MIKSMFFTLSLLISVLFNPIYAFMPVIDVHAIRSLGVQLSQMKKDYLAIKELGHISKSGLNQVASELHGQFSYGETGNAWDDVYSRYAAIPSWRSWSDSKENASMAFWFDAYQKKHSLWRNQAWKKSLSAEDYKAISSQLIQSRSISLDSEYAYDHSSSRQRFIHDLSAKIDTTQNTKAAIDLNSRLSAEAAYEHNAQIRQMALLNKQLSEEQYQHLAEKVKESSFTSLKSGFYDDLNK